MTLTWTRRSPYTAGYNNGQVDPNATKQELLEYIDGLRDRLAEVNQ